MPFKVVAKDDESGRISIEGQSVPPYDGGTQLDIYPQNVFMLTHNVWDQIWYWPDRRGETFGEVFDRFVNSHEDGDLVNAYFAPTLEGLGLPLIDRDANLAQGYRIDLTRVTSHRQLSAHAVCAIIDNGGAVRSDYDVSIPNDKWLKCGPVVPVQIEMKAYQWTLTAGRLILNADDFT
jgi:hypothetical protein